MFIEDVLHALEVAISQGGIPARTLALMQGSEVKKRKKKRTSTNFPRLGTSHRVQHKSNPNAKIRRRTPIPLHFRGFGLNA